MSSFKSSSSNPNWIHDVFLNFRGEDTRKNFVSHLYSSLSNAGINTFLDDEMLSKGQIMFPELWRAIEGSKIAIVVFSKNYADSSWCLDELQKIMECHRIIGQDVLPVFYDVDPSDVRRHKGTFGEILEKLAVRYSGMTTVVADWKRALTEAANLAGWDVRNCRSESDAVKDIRDAVLIKLDNTFLPITDFPVGLESRVQDVIQFLEGCSTEVCLVGLWGMGGSGKTTVAKAIYNEIHRKFEYRCFLDNIREVWEKDRGQVDLQEQLLSSILKTRKMKIDSTELGKAISKDRLCGKRVLVVLDDVNKFEQLNALCGNKRYIGPGSVIIVTTRDVRLLNVLKVDFVYRMKEMDENESLELFSCHAFLKSNPAKDFVELSRNVVSYCGGLPLALEVIGSYLYERTEEEWECVLSKLRRIPNDQIQEKLKISFDGLRDHMEKDIFLDICCFFIGMDRDYVTVILNGCGLHAEIGIKVLIERSLLRVEKNNKLGMHPLLRDMGREIVRESSPLEPEKRTRLWFHEDVLDVLAENTGTKAVEALALKWQRTSGLCFNTRAFEKMKRLRLLQLDHVQLDGDYGYLPKHLSWVYWRRFPLKYTPADFYQRNLVAIDLKHSSLVLVWKKPQLLEMLKIINLSHSRNLTCTPDFSKLPNLEKLILKDCPSLSKVHQSIGDLSNLLLLNLKDCISLSNLPRTIYKLKSLKTLILSGCSKIDKLEEDIVQMESLTTLIAQKTAVLQVPFSIIRSKSIGYISLCGYEGLSCDVFPALIWSWMVPAAMNPLSCIHSLHGILSSLVVTDVQNNNLGDLSPMLSDLSKLRTVWVQYSSEFQLTEVLRKILDDVYDVNVPKLETASFATDIMENSLRSLLIGMGRYHQVFNTLSKSISQVLTTSDSSEFFLPGDNYPYWLARISEGHSICFTMPEVSDCCINGMILCVLYSSTHHMATECLISVLIVNYTKCIIQLYKRDTVISFSDEEWQRIISNLAHGDKVEIFAAFEHGLTVKKSAIYLILGETNGVKKHSPKPKKNAFIGLVKRMRMCRLQSV